MGGGAAAKPDSAASKRGSAEDWGRSRLAPKNFASVRRALPSIIARTASHESVSSTNDVFDARRFIIMRAEVTPLRKGCGLPSTKAGIARRAWLGGVASLILSGIESAARAGAPGEVRRVLVIGDSQAQGLALGLQWLYRQDRSHRILDRSKIATGLTSRTGYDWPAQVRTLASTETADVAVVMFGANDRPPVHVGGHIDAALLQIFQTAYGSRVRDIVQTLVKAHMAVIWVGHPITRDPAFADDMALLNDIFTRNAVPAGATFLSLWDVFLGPDHGYDAYGPGIDGQTTRLRADDGVHLTAAGYEVAAKKLQPMIDAAAPTPVQPAAAGPTTP